VILYKEREETKRGTPSKNWGESYDCKALELQLRETKSRELSGCQGNHLPPPPPQRSKKRQFVDSIRDLVNPRPGGGSKVASPGVKEAFNDKEDFRGGPKSFCGEEYINLGV